MSGTFRLICALLTLLLALPAVQANACAPVTPAPHGMQAHDGHHGHYGHHGDEPAAPSSGAKKHDCVGCIPPIDIAVYRPAREPALAFALIGKTVEIRFDAALHAPPEPPPPRMTV